MPKNTVAHHEKRLIVLDEHIANLKFKGKEFSNQDLLNFLKEKNFDISSKTLERDLEELSSNNQFVANIGMHYSNYMENISKTYDRIQREAWKIFNQKWTLSRQVKKQILGRTNRLIDVTEIITTKEIAGPKLSALKLIGGIEKYRQELASGKNLELSAAMWIKKEKELQAEIKQLKSKSTKEKERILSGK